MYHSLWKLNHHRKCMHRHHESLAKDVFSLIYYRRFYGNIKHFVLAWTWDSFGSYFSACTPVTILQAARATLVIDTTVTTLLSSSTDRNPRRRDTLVRVTNHVTDRHLACYCWNKACVNTMLQITPDIYNSILVCVCHAEDHF